MRRFAWFGCALCAAVLLCVLLHADIATAVILACGAILLCLLALLLPRQRERAVLLCLGAALGLGWYGGYSAVTDAAVQTLIGSAGPVRAVVTDYAEPTERGYYLTVRAETGTLLHPTARLYLYGDEAERYEPGDVVAVDCTFRRADTINGEQTDVFTSRGVFATATLRTAPEVTEHSDSVLFFPARVRRAMQNAITALYQEQHAPFMTALLTGSRSALNRDVTLKTAMERAGVSHLVAVSGMHVSFLVGLLSLLIRRRRVCAAVSVPVIVFFMAVTGFSPSVSRAGIMQILVLLLPEFGRSWDSITGLSLAAVIILLFNPYAAASAGMQMSFAAVLGIVLISTRLQTWAMERIHIRLRPLYGFVRLLVSTLCASVGAMVFTLPLGVLYFGYVSLIAPVTNLLVVPVASILFCLGMLSCVFWALVPFLAAALAWAAGMICRYVLFVTMRLGTLRYSAVYTSNLLIVLWLLLLYGGAGILGVLRMKKRYAVLFLALAAAALAAILLITPKIARSVTLSTTVLDVGQGQCVILRSDENTVMVDCGSTSTWDAGDRAGKYLASVGEDRVDVLILSHYHADHVNGLEQLMAMNEVGMLLLPEPTEEDFDASQEILSLARAHDTAVNYVKDVTYVTFGSSEAVIYPPLGSESENERCCSLLAREGDFEVLMTADMPDTQERRLLEAYSLPDIEVLIVGHHGSRTSTCEDLLDAVTPETAVISVGANNTYGHPTEETLARLTERDIDIYRTDLSGTVTIERGT